MKIMINGKNKVPANFWNDNGPKGDTIIWTIINTRARVDIKDQNRMVRIFPGFFKFLLSSISILF